MIHNPKNYECGCDSDCWCRRTRIGRLVKWWVPARWFGIPHKNSFFDGMSWDEIREWKRKQEAKALYPMATLPGLRGAAPYEGIARLDPQQWGMTERPPGRGTVIRPTLPRLDQPPRAS